MKRGLLIAAIGVSAILSGCLKHQQEIPVQAQEAQIQAFLSDWSTATFRSYYEGEQSNLCTYYNNDGTCKDIIRWWRDFYALQLKEGKPYKRFEATIKELKIDGQQGNLITVSFLLQAYWYWEGGEKGEEGPTQDGTNRYVLVLRKENNSYVISDEKVLAEPWNSYPTNRPQELSAVDEEALPIEPVSPQPIFTNNHKTTGYTYSRSAAVTYAYTYTGPIGTYSSAGYNTAYRSYAPNDCANFISQCLKQGGWSSKNAYVSGTCTNNWWYSTNATTGDTYSWKSAHGLNAFMVSSQRAVEKQNVLDLQSGDVVIADWPNTSGVCDGTYDHAMLVTGVYSNDIIMNYHCINKTNSSFLSVKQGMSVVKNGVTYYPQFRRWAIKNTGN